MKVVIIGSGNVATVMGSTIVEAGHALLQVAARNEAAAAALSAEWDCGYTTRWEEIEPAADLYIVSLSDRALTGLNAGLRLAGRLVVHTAGVAPLSALAAVSERHGVLYPLQTLRKEVRPFPDFPLLIDAARPQDLVVLEVFAKSLVSQVQRADDVLRLKLHVAAVFANNFTNYLYSLSKDFCRNEGIDFSLLLPLIRETARRVERYDPRAVQTGPAVRGDSRTMERHLEVLSNYRNMSDLYRIISEQISDYYK
jgi:predicted short-subunit dehydrogenase-like oxidoreductase (DUF2520 family)